MKNLFSNNLRWLVMSAVFTPTLLVSTILIPYFLYQSRQSMQQELFSRADTIAKQLAYTSEYGLISGKLDFTTQLVAQRVLREESELCTIELFNKQHQLVFKKSQNCPNNAKKITVKNPVTLSVPEIPTMDLDDPLHASTDNSEHNHPIAQQIIGYIDIELSNHKLIEKQNHLLKTSLPLVIITLIISLYIGFLLSRRITRPLKEIGNTVTKIGNQQYDIASKTNNVNEISELASNVKSMADSLRAADKSVKQYILELTIAKNDAEDAHLAKSMFLNLVSEKIKEPISATTIVLTLLQENICKSHDKNDISMRYIKNISSSIKDLENRMHHIEMFSSLTPGEATLKQKKTNVKKIIDKTIENFQPYLKQKNINLSIEQKGSPNLQNSQQIIDSTLITQLISVIFTTMIFHDKSKEINLLTQWEPVEKNKLEISFNIHNLKKDTSLNHTERSIELNKPQSIDSSILFIKQLISMMDANITNISDTNTGIQFLFKVKLDYIQNNLQVKKPKKVFLLEGNTSNNEIFSDLTLRLGMKLSILKSRQELLKEMESNECQLIFIDHVPNDPDDTLFIQKLRKIELSKYPPKRTPLIAILQNASPTQRNHCMNEDIDSVISSPIKEWDLFKQIVYWLNFNDQMKSLNL